MNDVLKVLILAGIGLGVLFYLREKGMPDIPLDKLRMPNVSLPKRKPKEAPPETGPPVEGGESWSGTWKNAKRGTSGRLSCNAERGEGDQWRATFTGESRGTEFRYDTRMRGTPEGSGFRFEGTTDLDGDDYEWTGRAGGNTFTGQFRSVSGNRGRFEMTRQ